MTRVRPTSARRVLVTGGTGFIGAHLVRDCVDHGDQVAVLTRDSGKAWRLKELEHRVALIEVDPHDASAMARAIEDYAPEYVFHLAAATRVKPGADLSDLDTAIATNVAPLVNLVNALQRLPVAPLAVVRAGTYAEYGEHSAIHDAMSPERPVDAYGLSALMGTHVLRLARARLDLPAVTARLSLVYGVGQSSDFLIPQVIRDGLAGRPIQLRRPQSQRDLMHVDDAVAALRLVAERAAVLPPVLAATTGTPVVMGDVAEEIARQLGLPPPGRNVVGHPTVPHILSCRPSAALVAAGWRPRVGLREGLAQVIAAERTALLHCAESTAS